MIKATVKLVLDGKPLSNGKYAVYLRVLKDGKRKMISLGMQCDKAHFLNEQFTKQHLDYQIANETLLKLKSRAYEIIREYRANELDFTLGEFENNFRGRKSNNITVAEILTEKIDDLMKSGNIRNAKTYKSLENSFFKFNKNKKLIFREITHSLLDKYEVYLRSNNNKDGGVSVKMRNLRALFNDAIKKGIVEQKHYPFKEYKISKLKGKAIKRAVSRTDIRLMETINTDKHPHLTDARNYLMFSYYMGGMNFVDLMKLKWENIQGDRITYIRSKTKGRFTVKMLEPVKEILTYYKAQNRPTEYIFPILLQDNLTPIQIDNRRNKTLRAFNKKLKEIAKIQGVKTKFTSYVLRHSFATNLKYAGISSEIIGQSMGHKDPSVTQVYLKEFENDVLDDAMRRLLKEPDSKYAA